MLEQVVNPAGKAQAGVHVIVVSQKTARIAEGRADDLDRFSLVVPRWDIYRVVVVNRLFMMRVWHANVTPPPSKMGLLCVTDNAVREKHGSHLHHVGTGLTSLCTNPVVIGLGVAASIAVPIALDDDDDVAIGIGADLLLDDGEPAS